MYIVFGLHESQAVAQIAARLFGKKKPVFKDIGAKFIVKVSRLVSKM